MSRTNNGSWGALKIKVPQNKDWGNLLIYDMDSSMYDFKYDPNNQQTFDIDNPLTNYHQGMMYADNGWLPKSVFIANRNKI